MSIPDKKFKIEISNFLENWPLYKQFALPHIDNVNLFFLQGMTFKYLCQEENAMHTFELSIYPETTLRSFAEDATFAGLRNFKFTHASPRLDTVVHFIGKCSSCKNYHVDFLMMLELDGPIPQSNALDKDGKVAMHPNFFLKKIGQFPPFEITPEKDVLDYLAPEDGRFYKKGLICYSQGYGIGAFAYYRRIIENEIRRMANDLSDLNYEGAILIKEALKKYDRDHQMTNLIAALNGNLPTSFNSLGDNPIKLLYEQLSGGLHEFSEQECLEKSHSIDIVLKFIIKKINEEKYQISGVIDAMKSLRMSK